MAEEIHQLDLICGQCPLERCDEGSLFCMFSFLTKPNKAQREVVSDLSLRPYHTRRESVKTETLKRREYHQTRYRQKKLVAAMT